MQIRITRCIIMTILLKLETWLETIAVEANRLFVQPKEINRSVSRKFYPLGADSFPWYLCSYDNTYLTNFYPRAQASRVM